MGHFIILMLFGIAGLLLPKKEKERLERDEAEEWLREHEEELEIKESWRKRYE